MEESGWASGQDKPPLCFWTREQQQLLSRVAVAPQMFGFITCLDLSSLKRAFGGVFFPRTAESLTNLTGSSGNLGLVFLLPVDLFSNLISANLPRRCSL